MYNCPKCGAEVRHGAKFCEHCACEMNWDSVGSTNTNTDSPVNQAQSGAGKYSVMAIVGFILSFVFSGIISLILCIMGLKECKEKGYNGRGLAIAGIIISIAFWVLGIIIFGIIAASGATSGYYYY